MLVHAKNVFTSSSRSQIREKLWIYVLIFYHFRDYFLPQMDNYLLLAP